MRYFFILTILLLSNAKADIDTRGGLLVFADPNKKVEKLNSELMTFISDTLHLSKVSPSLNCDVKVRQVSDERKFSDGVHRVESLEIIYHTQNSFAIPQETIYFPMGSKIQRTIIVVKSVGTVEEIELEADDVENSRFIFHHNGRGVITFMSYENDLKTTPCTRN